MDKQMSTFDKARWILPFYTVLTAAIVALFAVGVVFPAIARAEDSGGYVTLYRVYNPNTGEHLYTSHPEEVEYLTSAGWGNEEQDQRMTLPESSSTPVYRLYNPANGDHHYTSDTNECSVLTSQYGWVYDFNGEAAFYSSDTQAVTVWRIYNSQHPLYGHLYTRDDNERNFWLSNGWNDENIGWYAFAAGEVSPAPQEHDTASQTDLSTVYWTPNGKSYHSTDNCPTLGRSRTILSGSLGEAIAVGKDDPCNVCVR